MTNQQYKNIVDWTLKNLDAAARDDSLSVARAVLNNCGVSLPEGGLPEILDALQSGDYMWWKSCTCEEARSFADEGQPVVGVDGGRLVVIVPSDTASGETAANGETAADAGNAGDAEAAVTAASVGAAGTASNSVTAEAAADFGSRFVLSAEALTEEQRTGMQFYASGVSTSTSTTTQQPERKLTLYGIPERPVAIKNSGFEIIACMDNDLQYTVDAEWITDSGELYVWKEFKNHTHIAHIVPLQNGPMTITAIYESQRCSFNITVYNMHLYLSPANHHKPYTKVDGTLYPISEVSERKNMENIAAYLKNFLNGYWVDVMVTDIHNEDQQYTGRPQEADAWIVNKEKGLYLALHSNARDKDDLQIHSGSVAFYNDLYNTSSLALNLVDAVDEVLPTISDRSGRAIKGEYPFAFGEMVYPKNFGIASIILEFGFHDNPIEADFLLKEENLLAETVGRTLVDFYEVERR